QVRDLPGAPMFLSGGRHRFPCDPRGTPRVARSRHGRAGVGPREELLNPFETCRARQFVVFIQGVGAPPPTLLTELTPGPQRACDAGGFGLRVSPSALLPELTPSRQRACDAGGLGLRVSPSALLPELTPSPQRACYAGGFGRRVSPSALLPELTRSPQRAC